MIMAVRLLKTLSLLAIMTLLISGAVMMASSEETDGATSSTLTFNSNYPDDSTDTSESYVMVVGATIQLPTQTFTLDGYALTGWSTTPSGTAIMDAGSEYVIKSGNTTLYARWTQLQGHIVSDSFQTIDVGTKYSFTATSDGGNSDWADYLMVLSNVGTSPSDRESKIVWITKPDWLSVESFTQVSNGLFQGVTTTLVIGGTPYSTGVYPVTISIEGYEEAAALSFVITVSANTDKTYTVNYDINGGSGTTPTRVTGIYGQAFVLNNGFVGSTEITRTSMVLTGWDVPNELGVSGTYPLDSVFGIYGNVTATAHWESVSNVIVFSMDGGSLENVNAYVVDTGELYSLPTTSNATKPGYTLIGWRATGDEQAAYAPGSLVEIEGVMKLEAYFVETSKLPSLCFVTYDYGDGSGTVTSQYVESGMYVYTPMHGMENGSLTFKGWSETPDGDVINTYSKQITEDTTLYAVWEDGSVVNPDDPEQSIFTVTFDPNGGNASVPQRQVYEGGLVSQPTGITREGYILVGWYSGSLDRLWNFQSDAVNGNILLTAQWEQHFTYTVSGLTATVTIHVGSQSGIDYAESATISWGDGSSEGTTSGSATHTYAGVNSSGRITVTSTVGDRTYTSYLPLSGLVGGHSPEIIRCTVTFDTNGGDTSSWSVTVDRYSTVAQPDDPVRDGYTFLGWYFYGSPWNFDAQVQMDMTLVASWKDDDTGEVTDPEDPDQPVVIHPTALGSITETADGVWTLDARRSVNAVSFAWYVDNLLVGSQAVCMVSDLSEGDHGVILVVKSSSGIENRWTGNIHVDEDDEGMTSWERLQRWISENTVILCVGIVVGMIALMAVRFYI